MSRSLDNHAYRIIVLCYWFIYLVKYTYSIPMVMTSTMGLYVMQNSDDLRPTFLYSATVAAEQVLFWRG